jgi:ethanolamine ammonia-lyase small subunit
MSAEATPGWGGLERLTPARVRLDPAGGPASLAAVLDFQACHARARDAIRTPVDWAALETALAALPCLQVASRAADRDAYIRRPDLGRRVADADLARLPAGPFDLAIVVADGLSGFAARSHAAPVILGLAAALPELSFSPVILAQQGRVAIGDEIGAAMRARLALVLIGERPGLSVADSLGAYLTFAPAIGVPDSARNCISNIHDKGGLDHGRAVELIAWLVVEALRREVTGIMLKDERTLAPPEPTGALGCGNANANAG